jgi:hypothetical protein
VTEFRNFQSTAQPPVVKAIQWNKNGDHPWDYREAVILPAKPGDGMTQYDGKHNTVKGYRALAAQEQAELDLEGQYVRRYRKEETEDDCPDCGRQWDDHGWVEEHDLKVCPGYYVAHYNDTAPPQVIRPSLFRVAFGLEV